MEPQSTESRRRYCRCQRRSLNSADRDLRAPAIPGASVFAGGVGREASDLSKLQLSNTLVERLHANSGIFTEFGFAPQFVGRIYWRGLQE